MNIGKCAVADLSEDKSHLVWKDAGCNPWIAKNELSLCQGGACDAESVACGLVNLPNINLTLVEMKKKMAMYKIPQMQKFHKKNLKVVRKL